MLWHSLAIYLDSRSRCNSGLRFESRPLRCTNVVKSTTFFLQVTRFRRPVAYPGARDSIVLTGPSVAAGVPTE